MRISVFKQGTFYLRISIKKPIRNISENYKEPSYNFSTVADPGCLSRILDVYPGSWIPYPTITTKEEEGKKSVVLKQPNSKNFYIILFLNMYRKQVSQSTKNCSNLYPKNYH
jgi:hypothetical protein